MRSWPIARVPVRKVAESRRNVPTLADECVSETVVLRRGRREGRNQYETTWVGEGIDLHANRGLTKSKL